MNLYILQTPYAYLVIAAGRAVIKAQTYNAASRQHLHRLITDLRATGPVDVADVIATTPPLMALMRRNEEDTFTPGELALLERHRGPADHYPERFTARERL